MTDTEIVPRIDFFCTDRGQHRRVDLGHTVEGSTAPVVFCRKARNAPERESYWDAEGKWIGGETPGQFAKRTEYGRRVRRMYVTIWFDSDWTNPLGTQFLCPKCPRNPQVKTDRLRAALAALRVAQMTEVDVSYLD